MYGTTYVICMFVLLLFVDHENLLTYMKVGNCFDVLYFGLHFVMATERCVVEKGAWSLGNQKNVMVNVFI